MWQFRLSKYDPGQRDAGGAFTGHTWTAMADIGANFDDGTLTEVRYRQVEEAYVEVLAAFAQEAGALPLRIVDLEIPADEEADRQPSRWQAGAEVSGAALEAICRANLRQELWCKLVHPSGFYLHFGYDLYSYVGTPHPSPESIALAARRGLFVETMRSPYLD